MILLLVKDLVANIDLQELSFVQDDLLEIIGWFNLPSISTVMKLYFKDIFKCNILLRHFQIFIFFVLNTMMGLEAVI